MTQRQTFVHRAAFVIAYPLVVPLLYVLVVLLLIGWGCWGLITGGWRLIKRVFAGRWGRRAVALRVYLVPPVGDGPMADAILEPGQSIELSSSQRRRIRVVGIDSAGNVVLVEGLALRSDNPEVAYAVPADEGTGEYDIITTGVAGSTEIEIEADAKIGEGRLALVRVIEIDVNADGAVGIRVVLVGEPVSRVEVVVPQVPQPVGPSA